MKHTQILYPSKTKSLDDLIYFSNWNLLFPHYQQNTICLNDEEKNSSGKNLDKDNWTYFINKYGFRGDWQLNSDKKKIGFFGCSITLGQGVKEEYTFPSLVEQQFNHKLDCLNFGISGSSNQRIAKVISAVSKIIKFEIAVITLPPTTRISYIHKVGMLSDLLPSSAESYEEKSFYNLFSQDDFDMYSSDAIHWIQSELKDTKILWSSWCPNTYNILNEIVDKQTLLSQFPLNDNNARDNKHPGKFCHSLYSKMIKEKIESLNWIS